MGERREPDPLRPPQPFTRPVSPRGPRLPEPSRNYHRRTWARTRPAPALAVLHPRLTLTPKSAVASPPPPGARCPVPAPAPGGSAAPVRRHFRVLPPSVLKTNCPSTATPRLRSGAGVPRLEQPLRAPSRRPLVPGWPASPLRPRQGFKTKL